MSVSWPLELSLSEPWLRRGSAFGPSGENLARPTNLSPDRIVKPTDKRQDIIIKYYRMHCTMLQKLSKCEVKVHNSLCSRNFLKVKLRIDFVEI